VSYLNVTEVETALALAARPENAAFTELVTLPNRTWEGRTCSALRINDGEGGGAGVYLLGGVHAREWGSSDILIHFVQVLTEAYRTSTGITQPGVDLGAEQVQVIVNNLDVVVFPQANPDGRFYSMTVDPMWRKNRRPADAGQSPCRNRGGDGPGVDINRNYDFLWDYKTKFAPDAPVQTSDDPCSEIYRGPSAASEPETRNVTWLLDQYPTVTDFIDVHSFGEKILYNWGDDDDQSKHPMMNFHNPDYDGKRGFPNDTRGGDPTKYQEYIPPEDLKDEQHYGVIMRDAIESAHGREYKLENAVGLYPTSGTSDDWAYSRYFLDDAKYKKVRGYTIEWGPNRPVTRKAFHPDYPDMVPIIEEITAGLLAFCSALATSVAGSRQIDQSGAVSG
jgi:carboxypeptidase T